MKDRMSRRARVSLLAMLIVTSALSATRTRADIVWDGKPVTAWPDTADPLSTYAATGFYPAPKGVVFGLTILVDFSDQAPAFTKTQVEDWLNERGYDVGGVNGSVRDYFFDVSNGMVDFQNDVVGFYRAKRPKSYYEAATDYSTSDELWHEILDALDPMIDFNKYDNDKNGRTEAISIVYAGPQVTWGQGLWPHATNSREQRDGVTLNRYMLTQMGKQLGLYTFCHESGHMLFGWPDLYGFGDYCLMGNATSQLNPAGINDFYRADQGWIPQTELTASSNARYSATPNGGGFRYRNPARTNECFFWSNVQNTGRFKVLKGGGVLVLHFDKSIGSNDPPNPLSLDVVEADGRTDLSATMWPSPGSSAGDFFAMGGNTTLSDTTKPAARWNDGSSTGLKIYEVSASEAQMTFAVGTGMAATQILDGGVPIDAGASTTSGPHAGSAGTAGMPARANGSAGGGVATAGSSGSASNSAGSGGTQISNPPSLGTAAGTSGSRSSTSAVSSAAASTRAGASAFIGTNAGGAAPAFAMPAADQPAAEGMGCATARAGTSATNIAPCVVVLLLVSNRRRRAFSRCSSTSRPPTSADSARAAMVCH